MVDIVLLIVRIVLGGIMIYYGWPKVKDPAKNARDFSSIGFKPGWLWGSVVLVVEFGGGLLIMLGLLTPIAATLFGFEMLIGFIWKATKAGKPFVDWSYDVQLLALCLLLLAVGPGAFSIDAALWSA
jgi:putative oxidoreductase